MPGHSRNIQAGAPTFTSALCPVTLHIITNPQQALPLLDLYQQVINWVDPKLKLFRATERKSASCQSPPETNDSGTNSSDIPAIAMTIFLREADEDNHDLENARQVFQHPPWRLHHSEKLGHNNINALARNSHDFYYTSRDLPLWAARHVHYGREHVRYVLYVPDISWPDQLNFYRLILNLEADLVRDDFCLFTVYTQDHYDVQFALKKIDSNLRILTLQNVYIHVKVKDTGHLVPLFPNVCHPISDVKWQTTDHDGNVVVIDASPVDSRTKNTFTPNTTNYHAEQAAKVDLTFSQLADSHRKEQTRITRNNALHNLQFGVSDLSLNVIPNRNFSHNHHFESPTTSDLDDLGIDLPSPPLRLNSRPEEDEQSLTLTNTSEESGIHMQQGCDDISFGEDESLRSCLTKNSSLRVRHVKFKVRFKEEIQTFNDSFSPPSPCSESDGHSEAEMETRFPYVPSSEEKAGKLKESSSHAATHVVTANRGRNGLQTISGNHCTNIHDSVPPSSLSLDHASQCSQKCPISIKCDQDTVRHPQIKDNSLVRTTPPDTAATTCTRYQTMRPHQQMSDSPICHSPQTHTNIIAKKGINIKSNTPLHCPYSQCPSRRNCICSKNQIANTIHRTSSSNELTNICPDQAKQLQACYLPSGRITPAKDSQDRQLINKSASNIFNNELPPTTPPTGDKNTKHFSSQSNSAENKSISDNHSETDPRFQKQNVQSGLKRFWFADTNLDLSKGGCSGQEETTLKFTLKYDTCPTSGLSSGQEQIGFYV